MMSLSREYGDYRKEDNLERRGENEERERKIRDTRMGRRKIGMNVEMVKKECVDDKLVGVDVNPCGEVVKVAGCVEHDAL